MGLNKFNISNCDVPTNVNTNNVSNFSATLNWNVDSLISHYRVRYRESGNFKLGYDHNVPQKFKL